MKEPSIYGRNRVARDGCDGLVAVQEKQRVERECAQHSCGLVMCVACIATEDKARVSNPRCNKRGRVGLDLYLYSSG